MLEVSSWINEISGITPQLQGQILKTFVLLVVLWIVRRTLSKLVNRRSKNLRHRYFWRNTVSYVTLFIGVLALSRIWFTGGESLFTYLGLLSAGIAIALQSPLVNLAGWLFIMLRSPIKIGDRIEIGSHRGDVIDLRLFQFTLNEIGNWVDGDQSTGRIISIPNGRIFSESLANYSRGLKFLWLEMGVQVTFESDWKHAKKILTEIADEHSDEIEDQARRNLRKASNDFLIEYNKLTPIVYTSVKDSGIMLTIRFLCDPRQRRGKENEIWEAILTAFDKEEKIDLAYPTMRYFNNPSEGKIKND